MSCSRWLSIQSRAALATPVDSHCVSPELRRFDTTRTSIPSTRFNTHANLPCSRQSHRTLPERAPNQAQNYSGVGDGLGEGFCTSSILRCLSARRSCIRCSRSVLIWEGSGMRPWSSGGIVRRARAGAGRGTGATLPLVTNFSRSANAFSLSSNAFSRASNSVFR